MMKLLVVDDSELILSRLVVLLQGIPGMTEIDTAATLAQTLDRVQRVHPTMLILDLHLPDGNALQILPALRQLEPGMQIAMLSNDASEFSRTKCMQAGADWFFDKSTEFENVLAVVQKQAALNSTISTQGGQRP
jgi:two-component system, OmpR family, response regulator